MENIYVTHEGFEKLRKNLDELVNKIRPEAVDELVAAREKGDLSENAEYDAAKEKLAGIDRQIGDLQTKFSNVQLVDAKDLKSDEVRILSRVTIVNTKNDVKMDYTIVDPVQADPSKRLLSIKSPIAQGLLGKKAGETVEIEVPSGKVSFKIERIELNTDI